MQTTDTAPTTDLTRVRRELRAALARYEALASTPRHLVLSAVADRRALERAVVRAILVGDRARAADLAEQVTRDDARIARLAQFRRDGRSSRAWREVAGRLADALRVARSLGAIDGEPARCVADRVQDAIGHALSAELRERDERGTN